MRKKYSKETVIFAVQDFIDKHSYKSIKKATHDFFLEARKSNIKLPFRSRTKDKFYEAFMKYKNRNNFPICTN